MKSNFKKKTIKTLFAYNVFFVIVVMIIYCVITRLLSYPPNSINTEFEKNIDTVIAANGGETEFNIVKYINIFLNLLC